MLIGLVDFSFLLDSLLVQCRKMVSRSCFERLLLIQVPVRKMVLFLELIVSVALLLFKNWSISSVLEAASWKSNTVFPSFYLRNLQYIFEGVRSLGPFVAAGERIG